MSDDWEEFDAEEVAVKTNTEPAKEPPSKAFSDEFTGTFEQLEQEVGQPEFEVPESQPKVEQKAVVVKPLTQARQKKIKLEALARKEAAAIEAENRTSEQIKKQREEDENRKRESDLQNANDLFAGLDEKKIGGSKTD